MKKLITYLKTLWSRVADSQRKEVGVISEEGAIEHPFSTYSAPFGTCWQPSGKLHSVVRYTAMLVMLFTIGVGNVWADYTITFKTNGASDGTSAQTTIANLISSGGDYVNSVSAGKAYNAKDGFGVKLGSSSATGSVEMTMKSSGSYIGQIKASKLTVNAAYYDSGKTLKVTVTYTDATTTTQTLSSLTASITGYDVSLTSSKTIQKIKIESVTASKGRVYCGSIVVVAAAAATPTVTPDPTNLSWGTVLQGSSQGNKTISITGTNLTAGTLTISATGGYSVTPTSKSVSGTLSATTLTVTPPSTATTGAKNGKVTISGGGLSSNVEVNLSMTVNAASTVTWMNNGSEYTTTLVENGQKPTFPSNPSSCDGTSTTFYGWSTSEWSGKIDDISAKTIYTSAASMPTVSGAITYYAVFCKGGANGSISITSNDLKSGLGSSYGSGSFTKTISGSNYTFNTYACVQNSTFQMRAADAYIQIPTLPGPITGISSTECHNAGTGNYNGTLRFKSAQAAGNTEDYDLSTKAINATSFSWDISGSYTSGYITTSAGFRLVNLTISYGTPGSKYLTNCCTDPELAYGTGSVTKTYGASAFTNTLTNSHNVAVTYSSSDPTVATVNGSGQVTIQKAGSTTITASSIAQTVSTVDYCADEASYTLTVNKASISPTLTYTPNSVAVGENTSAPTVGANPGSGGVTYAITSATPAGCATIDAGTGVVSGVAVGSVTVTATVAATANYNGGTATANVTITAASYFTNGATVFVQAESSSAWDASACVKAWFNASGAGGAAQTTYWLFDATDGDAGKKLYATIVPASGDLNQVTLQRFASNCSDFWNNNGTLTKASDGGSNTFRSTGSGTSNVAWNGTGMTLDLKGDPNSWGSSLGTFADQGNGVWTATYDNYAPANAAGESQDFKISTNYNGWIGNKVDGSHQNENATLSGMHVGSTYNITATLDVKDHSLTMSKTFVKGTVHFNLQGHGSAISDLTNVAAGSKISAPSAPSATGWDFGGWYKEPACTNAWNFGSDVVNETMTLYAKWTAHEYTITKTLTNVTSSPAIPSTYTYTGVAAGLNYTISPSDGYRLPTEITVSGTTYTWNPATGALALTGTISSNVTITIVAIQTHTVDWYVGGSAPANKIGDDGQTTVVDHGGKISDFPATTPDGSACDKEFVGWTNTSSYVHGTSPLFNDVAGSPTINANASFYAVFAEDGGSSYVLVESDLGTDWAGDYLIAYSDDIFADGRIAGTGSSAIGASGIAVDPDDNLSGKVVDATWGDTYNVTLEEIMDGDVPTNTYVLKTKDGNYNYISSNTNGVNSTNTKSTAANHPISITYTSSADIALCSHSTKFHYNTSGFFRFYKDGGQQAVYLYKKSGGYSDYTINCADCGSSVTPTYTAAPTGGTVSVTKNAAAVASGSTVKTCTSVDLTVTITPASHYTLTGFTATGLSTGTATISPTVGSVLPTTSAQTFTVTVSASATGTLNLTPVLTEDAHKVISWVVHGSSASIADGHGTTWVYSGENLTAIPDAPDAPTGCDDKEFVGWSENDGGATEGDASDYTDLFTTLGGAPTGITTNRTFYAVFATPAAGMGGTVIWDEPFDGDAGDQPSSPTSGATVYGSASIAYNCASTTYCKLYTDNLASGGAASPDATSRPPANPPARPAIG